MLDKHVKHHQNADGIMDEGILIAHIFITLLKKYSWDNFEHEIVAQNLTMSEANELESRLIAKYKTMNQEYGYNLTSG